LCYKGGVYKTFGGVAKMSGAGGEWKLIEQGYVACQKEL